MADAPDLVANEMTRAYDPYVAKLSRIGLRPLGAYAARRCPVRTQLQFDAPSGVAIAAPSAAMQRRFDKGNEFEALITQQFDGALRIDRDVTDAVAATVRGMESGAPVIVGGTLPNDDGGGRTGRPDVLVRAGERLSDTGKPCYWPIDVKNHRALAESKGLPASVSPLDTPFFEDAETVDDRFDANSESRRNDLLQLAHYWRMLEACGHGASGDGPVWGGIIGNDEPGVVWADLSWPRFRSNAAPFRDETESALQRYDFEFAFRLDIAATAVRHREDPAIPLLTDPMKCAECADCEWRDHCLPALMGGSGDVSLLPRVGYKQWSSLRRIGYRSRVDLAAVDPTTARLIDDFPVDVSLLGVFETAGRHEPATPMKAVLGRKAVRQLRALDACGIANAGDLLALDPRALSLQGEVANVAELVDIAWVAVHGGGRPHRRRDVGSTAVPRADIEIDIDMENDFDGAVYLWGTLLTNRSDHAFREANGYRPFARWEDITATAEGLLFEEFWEWILAAIEAAKSDGLTVKVYSWHDAAEIGKLRRAAPFTGNPRRRMAEIRTLVADVDVWVDLEREFNRVAVGAAGSGLKKIAPFAGASWDAVDAGGDLSMLWHEDAIGGDLAAQSRLLRYNEDDVAACLAIREWLCHGALPALPR